MPPLRSLFSNPGGQLAVGRIVIGIGSWAVPRLVERAFGIDAGANPAAGYPMRLFAVRDLILGLGALNTSGDERKRWLQAGLACDLADIAAAGVSAKDGSLPPGAALFGGAAAVSGAALGLLALRSD